MHNLKKMKVLILVMAFMGSTALFAQVPPVKSQEQTKTEVKKADLEDFATVYKQVLQKNNETQENMVQTIKKEGLTVKRYRKLRTADQNPNAEVEATPEELTKKNHIDAALKQMSMVLEREQTNIIKASNISMNRYQEIALAISNDKDLQQQFQAILMAQD